VDGDSRAATGFTWCDGRAGSAAGLMVAPALAKAVSIGPGAGAAAVVSGGEGEESVNGALGAPPV
jgi:hypothetical protein